MSEQIVSSFKKLTAVEHVLKRPQRYIGSIQTQRRDWWVLKPEAPLELIQGQMDINPGFLKLFDEIITNSVDHSQKPEGSHLNRIDVFVNRLTNQITVFDNGGIPVVEHPEYKQLIPDMIFGELRSGSNFDDDATVDVAGQNGEGASLVNIFSKLFHVSTGDGKNSVAIEYVENMSSKTVGAIKPCVDKFTRIVYQPDFERLGLTGLTDDLVDQLFRRCVEIAALTPSISISFNGAHIACDDFRKFLNVFGKQFEVFQNEKWSIAVGYNESFTHYSYVNRTQTYDGGTHVDLIIDKIVDTIRPHIEKKTKTTVLPADLKSRMFLVLAASIPIPRYTSQTKEKLVTPASDYRASIRFTEHFEKQLINSELVKSLIQWVSVKKQQDDMLKANQTLKAVKREGLESIPKYYPATSKDRSECTLFICEGDSAVKPLYSARDPKTQGLFALQGKPENSFGKTASKSLTKEIINLMIASGLSIGQKDFSGIRYSRIVFTTDADLDGIHIRGLLLQLFRQFWPDLLLQGKIYLLKTPAWVCTDKGSTAEFIEEEEFNEFMRANPKAHMKYYKGLGSHDTVNFRRFLTDEKYLIQVSYDPAQDDDLLSMAFDPDRADDRKLWVSQGV